MVPLVTSRCSATVSALLMVVMMVTIPLARLGTTGKDVLQGDKQSGSNARTLRDLLLSRSRAVTTAERTHTAKTPERLGSGGRSNSHRRRKSLTNGDDPGYRGVSSSLVINRLEQAITHLAGAVGVGTEPLIYVRRSDVAEVVDTLLCQARKPGGPEFNSPALERLAIVRRSAGKSSESEKDAVKRPGSSTRKGSVTRGRNLNEIFRYGEAIANIPSSNPRESPSVEVENGRRGEEVKPGDYYHAAESSRPSPFRGSPRSRVAVGNATRRSGSGWDGDHPRTWRMRSPPRIRCARPSSLPDEKMIIFPKSPSASPKSGAIAPESVTRQDSKSPNPSTPSRKITFVPITPRASPGAGAFEEFWSTGLT